MVFFINKFQTYKFLNANVCLCIPICSIPNGKEDQNLIPTLADLKSCAYVNWHARENALHLWKKFHNWSPHPSRYYKSNDWEGYEIVFARRPFLDNARLSLSPEAFHLLNCATGLDLNIKSNKNKELSRYLILKTAKWPGAVLGLASLPKASRTRNGDFSAAVTRAKSGKILQHMCPCSAQFWSCLYLFI